MWKLDADRPIYMQIVERIEKQIISGAYGSGDRIPSVRELAAQAGVNPNTMQRAMTELERKGLIAGHRTRGRVVTEDREMIEERRGYMAKEMIREFLWQMRELGFDKEEILPLLRQEVTDDV
ncbi:MAG: GntR family transcriptional regulator [Lachnospiraceae bacterium]|nr:GntR family transcriptional regulator [Lachnospiraceae bacterium]